MKQISSIESGKTYESSCFVNLQHSESTIVDCFFTECSFKNCHLEKCVLKRCYFETCTFDNCNFTMAKFIDTTIKSCSFTNSHFVGVDFTALKTGLGLDFTFTNCNLSFTVFSAVKFMKSSFKSCNLEESEFSGAVAQECSFIFSKLGRTVFHHTDLTKSDFRGATDYYIDTRNNTVKGAQFSAPEVMNLLDPLGIKISEPPSDDTEI